MDEAQNITRHEIKTIISRMSEGSKIVLTGDPDQIDSPFLDRYSNGLAHACAKLSGEPIVAKIHLTKGERSATAELAALKL